MVACAALDGEADDFFGVHIRLVLRLLLDVAHLQGDVVPRFVEDIFREQLFRFLAGELGDLFQLLHHEVVLVVHLFLHLFDFAFLCGEVLFLLFERIGLSLQRVLFFIEVVLFLQQALFRLLQFELLFFGFAFEFVP